MLTLDPIELDLAGWIDNLKRKATPKRVFYYEHAVDEGIQQELDERYGICEKLNRNRKDYAYLRTAAIHRFLGQELFRVFPDGSRINIPTKQGEWVEEGKGPVTTWEEFEQFSWPRPEDMDMRVFDYYEHNLPDNMRVFIVTTVWEAVRDLIGFETFCYKLYDDREFIDSVFEKVGEFNLGIVNSLCDYDCLGAVLLSDDLGYKTSTFIEAKNIRELIIPWHKKLGDIPRRHGKCVLFHSCGQMYEVMDDYIDIVKIDAKHSFEEVVMPVAEVKKRYGDRLSLLGGMDVDLLARADEQTIRTKTRDILDGCFQGGGYFLGSGNWVTKYIPLDNYLVMLDEGRRYTSG